MIYSYCINEVDIELHMTRRLSENEYVENVKNKQESREVELQHKVEELEKAIETWERKYSNMERERNNINIGYRMVVDEKKKIEEQKKALATVNGNLLHTQADKNAEILTLRGELGRLEGEVARLEGEVERLTIQNKRKSSSNWSFLRNKSNMQTLLEDLNNFRK